MDYYCDGSYSPHYELVCAGIVGIEKNEVKAVYSVYEMGQTWFDQHEEYAIFKTLLLVEKQENKNIVIYNDHRGVVEALRQEIETEQWNERLDNIRTKWNELKEKGYRITFKHPLIQKYNSLAHQQSRVYLKNEHIQHEALTFSLKNQTPYTHEKQLFLSKVGKGNTRTRLRMNETNHYHFKKRYGSFLENPHLNVSKIKESNIFKFIKISQRKWAVFANEQEMVHVSESLEQIAYDVLKEAKKHHQAIFVNKQFLYAYRDFLTLDNQKNMNVKKVTETLKWLNEETTNIR